MDWFETLGIRRGLVIGDESLREAFRREGKLRHPDAGGAVGEFEELQEAMRGLGVASKRLRHWLECEGIEGDWRGAVGEGLMDLFLELGPVLQRADACLREREGARSDLARAMMEGRVQEVREELEGIQEKLGAAVAEREGRFEGIERGEVDGWAVARDLAFLEKWQGQVRERFAGLW